MWFICVFHMMCQLVAFFMNAFSLLCSSRTIETRVRWITVLDDEAWSILSPAQGYWQTEPLCPPSPHYWPHKSSAFISFRLAAFHRTPCAGIVWLTDGNRKGKLTVNWIEEVCYFLWPYGFVCDVSRENIRDRWCDSKFPLCTDTVQ